MYLIEETLIWNQNQLVKLLKFYLTDDNLSEDIGYAMFSSWSGYFPGSELALKAANYFKFSDTFLPVDVPIPDLPFKPGKTLKKLMIELENNGII